MFDDSAILFVSQDKVALMAWGIGVFVAGFLLALGIQRHSLWSLRRVPYFVAVSGILVLQSAMPVVWVGFSIASEDGGLGLLVASILLGTTVLGYLYGVISHARSLDGYGHGRSALLALVPIANLLLFFKAPSQDKKPASVFRMATNVAGVVLGFGLLALSQVMELMAEQAEAYTGATSTRLQTARQAQTLENKSTHQTEVVEIKGLHNAMNLDEVLMTIHARGGTCSSKEWHQNLSNKTVVSTSCRVQDGARQGDWHEADVFLSSDRTRSGLVLTSISFNCAYTNTCGMTYRDVSEALKSAGVVATNIVDDLVHIKRDGGIMLWMVEADRPNFD